MPKEKYLTRAAAPGKRKRMRDKAAGSESQPRSKKSTAKPVNGNRQNVSDDDDDDDEVIGLGSIDDMDLTERVPSEGESEDEGGDAFLETPAEKRLRLAKEYIAKMKYDLSVDADEFDAAKVDQDLIADRLVKDSLERSGKIHKIIAEYYSKPVRNADVRYLKNGHHLSVTCVVVTPNGKYVYSGSKDGSIVKWDFATGKRLKTFPGQKKTSKKDTSKGHRDQVLCLAVSSDSAYLASGGKDRQIHVWSIETDEHLVTFHQHKDSVTGLAFRRGQNQLYSCSLDRMVKLWNVDELAYAETLYGHQDGILAISTLQREQAVTVGSRDRNLRLWKVAEGVSHKFVAGTQTDPEKYLLSGKARQGNRGEGRTNDEDEEVSLAEDISSSESEGEEGLEGEPHVQEADTGTSMLQIIRHWDSKRRERAMKALRRRGANLIEGSLDVVAMLDENTFVTGGDSGAISLWHKSRKKPIFTQHLAHGVDEQQQQQQQDALNPCWITALATLPLSDMFVSGSWDGWVRVWKLVRDKRQSFELVNAIKVPGFVNSIDLFEDHESKGRGDTKVLSVEPNNVCMVLGIGQEPRMGRWARTKETRNHVRVITLRPYWVKKKQVQEEGA